MTDPLTPQRIAELRALEKAATPGPWRLARSDDTTIVKDDAETDGALLVCSTCPEGANYEIDYERMEKDAAYIFTLRNAAPALLDAAEALPKAQARIAELERETFALAADQCHAGYGDDFGNHRCKEVDAAMAAGIREGADIVMGLINNGRTLRAEHEDAIAARLLNQGGGE